jgi:hypothetical protein
VSRRRSARVRDLSAYRDIGEERVAVQTVSDVLGDLVDIDDAYANTVTRKH